MTIDELAGQNKQSKYPLSSERTYDNIRKLRNVALRKGFAKMGTTSTNIYFNRNDSNNNMTEVKTNTISGVEYINATDIANLNSAWLFISRLPKNIIWITDTTENNNELSKITKDLGDKLRQVFVIDTLNNKQLLNDNENIPDLDKELLEDLKIASSIAFENNAIIFTCFADKPIKENLSMVFEDFVSNL